MTYALRPVQSDDSEFLYQVYASTRADELASVGWDRSQQEAFLQMQFKLQTRSYRERFPDADYQIVLHDGQRAGRMIVARSRDEIRLIDLALLPEHRGVGIGSALIGALQDEAGQANKPLRLHVEVFNRAQRLYERLGFVAISQEGLYLELESRADSTRPTREPPPVARLDDETC